MEIYLRLINDLIVCTKNLFEGMLRICGDEDIYDINAHQIFIICQMKPIRIYTVGDLSKIYPLTNISYNLKSLCKAGYLQQIPGSLDKRQTMMNLTEKGEKLYTLMKDKLGIKSMTYPNSLIKEMNNLTLNIRSMK